MDTNGTSTDCGCDPVEIAYCQLHSQAPGLLSLARHIQAMRDDAYLSGHPEWAEIAAEADAVISKIDGQ